MEKENINKENLKILTDHTSSENAYMVENYPYGFKKTLKRYWIESKNKFGQRLCTQTLNPKTGNWNNVKKGTYSSLILLTLNPENNHVVTKGLNNYSDIKEITNFENEYQTLLTDFQIKQIKYLKALNNAWKHITVTVGESSNDKQPQTREEQKGIVNKCFNYEYSKLK